MTKPPERVSSMKSSTNKFPGGFQDVKHQSIRPLKRMARRLFQNKLLQKTQAQVGQTVSRKMDALTKAASFSAESKASKSSKLFLNLLLVRPWILVVGFWLLSMGIGSLALEGMLSPHKLTTALPEPAVEESAGTKSSALLNVEQGSDELVSDSSVAADNQETAVATAVGKDTSSVPVVPLVALVGACAVGSLAISRRRAMIRMASVRAHKGRARQGQKAVNSTAKVFRRSMSAASMRAKSVQTKSVQTKLAQAVRGARSTNESAKNSTPQNRPGKSLTVLGKTRLKNRRSGSERNARNGTTSPRYATAIAAQQQSARGRVLASRMNVQVNGQQGTPAVRSQTHRSARTASARSPKKGKTKKSLVLATNRQQPVVSVVPANETHALDWTNSSLAHQFDVRPQRSAM